MPVRLSFSVPGRPRGKGRPRASARIVWKDGEPEALVTMHTPRDTVVAERAVAHAFRRAHPRHQALTGPVKLTVIAVFQTPESWNRTLRQAAAEAKVWHVARGQLDLDNAVKLVSDALNGVAFVDDAQVAVITSGKRYGTPERVDVVIESLEQPEVPATPGQLRLEALSPEDRVRPRRARKSVQTKSESKSPPTRLELAIAAALERDGREGRQ